MEPITDFRTVTLDLTWAQLDRLASLDPKLMDEMRYFGVRWHSRGEVYEVPLYRYNEWVARMRALTNAQEKTGK